MDRGEKFKGIILIRFFVVPLFDKKRKEKKLERRKCLDRSFLFDRLIKNRSEGIGCLVLILGEEESSTFRKVSFLPSQVRDN